MPPTVELQVHALVSHRKILRNHLIKFGMPPAYVRDMKTSDIAKQLGLYVSACCDTDAIFDIKESFSRCPCCESLCFWQFVEPVVSWMDLDQSAEKQSLQAA